MEKDPILERRAQEAQVAKSKTLRSIMIILAVVAAIRSDNKPTIAVFLSQPLVEAGRNAGAMIKSAARHIQGGGGGQPWMATAGGRDVNGLEAAMEELLKGLTM